MIFESTRVIRPNEIIDYSQQIIGTYPPEVLHKEPLIGLKILCRDSDPNTINFPGFRLNQIETALVNNGAPPLMNTGCGLREAKRTERGDGYWMITFPAPKSCINDVFKNVAYTLNILSKLRIVPCAFVEINVSGRCTPNQVESTLNSLRIPNGLLTLLEPPVNSPYKIGEIVRINDNFMCLRTRWKIDMCSKDAFDNVSMLTLLISSIYH